MGLEALFWLGGLAIGPVSVMGAFGLGFRDKRLYSITVVCACMLVGVSLLPLAFLTSSRHLQAQLPLLAFIFIPFMALLWMLTIIVTPSGHLDDAGLARTATACLLTMGAFMTTSPLLLIMFWMGTSIVFIFGHLGARFARVRRIATAYLGASSVLMTAGWLIALWSRDRGEPYEQWGIGMMLAAVLIRKGIFPFHAWVPEVFDRGRIGPAVLFSAPQLGTYAALVIILPHASPPLLRAVAVLGLITAVYGALLALHQTDARRACGYLFVSQSALVISGLDLSREESLTGALIIWLSSGLAIAGLSRCVLVLEARRGRLMLDRYHGGYERMPLLASCFLILSLAIANFPGTLGFVGGEMLLRGAVETFPWLGLSVIIATALAGLAAMRMYFSLFCGRRDAGVHLTIKRSEWLGFAAAALILLGCGLAPAKLVRELTRTSQAVTESRNRFEKRGTASTASGGRDRF